jgi:lipoprotein signal peptidase
MLGLVGWWYYKERDWRLLLIILGGALNFGEKLIRGYVTDYWIIPGTNIYNNLNDWLIFGGAVLYIWKKLK